MKEAYSVLERIFNTIIEFVNELLNRIMTPIGIILVILLGVPTLDSALKARVLDMAFGALTPTIYKKARDHIRDDLP